MRIFEYRQRFYVDKDLIKALKHDGVDDEQIKSVIAFFCLLCYKDKPIYEGRNFKIQMIGGTYDEGIYILNGNYHLTQDMLVEILRHKHKTKEEIENLLCTALLLKEAVIDDKHTIHYMEPQIDYREVMEIINDYLNESDESRLLRIADYEIRREKARQNIIEKLDDVKTLLEEQGLPESFLEDSVVLDIPEEVKHDDVIKEWPYYNPSSNPENVYFHTEDKSEHYSIPIEEEPK